MVSRPLNTHLPCRHVFWFPLSILHIPCITAPVTQDSMLFVVRSPFWAQDWKISLSGCCQHLKCNVLKNSLSSILPPSSLPSQLNGAPTTNRDNNNKNQNKTKQAKTSGHLLLSPPTSLLNGHHLLLFQTGLSWSHCATTSLLLLFDSTDHFSPRLFQHPPTSRPTSNTLSKVVREKDKSDYAATC